MEAELRKRIQNRLIPDAEVTLSFVRGRPPLQPNDASRALAAKVKALADEQKLEVVVRDRSTGGGTDAAYAAMATKAAVIEGLGVRGYGAHSSDSEYVVVDAIAPKLVLVTRLVMAIGSGKALDAVLGGPKKAAVLGRSGTAWRGVSDLRPGPHAMAAKRATGGRTRRIQPFGYRTICVQRNSAIVLPLCVTVASQTWVVRPMWTAVAVHSMTPSRAVPRWLDLSSTVVKFWAPSGSDEMQP